jgi:hypothetical protein
VTKVLQFRRWFRDGTRPFSVQPLVIFLTGLWTRVALKRFMTNATINENRLFAKPRCPAFETSRPGGVMPARFRPSIALPPRTNAARCLPAEKFLTTADRPIASALPTSSTQN